MIISASLEPSYVMRALGVRDDLAHTSIRIGLSRFTKEWEVDAAVDMIVEQVRRLRDLSPLWEMKQQGIDLSTIQWSSHYSCLLKISYASKNHGSLPPSPSYIQGFLSHYVSQFFQISFSTPILSSPLPLSVAQLQNTIQFSHKEKRSIQITFMVIFPINRISTQ